MQNLLEDTAGYWQNNITSALRKYPQNCIAENTRVAQNQGEYQKRYNGLVERYEKATVRFDELTAIIAERSDKGRRSLRDLRIWQGMRESEVVLMWYEAFAK